MIGIGSQYLARFQKPYNLNAQSETTVEIIDAPVVLDTQAEPDLRNQAGRFDTTGRNSGGGVHKFRKQVVPVPTAQIDKEGPPNNEAAVEYKQTRPGFGLSIGLVRQFRTRLSTPLRTSVSID